MKLFKSLLSIIFILSSMCYAQDLKLPNDNGNCGSDFMPYNGICISVEALEKKGAGIISKELANFIHQSRDKIKIPEVCETKIESDNGDILKLENGAIVEILTGYLGYVGYRKSSLIFKKDSQWQIYIEGKKVFKIDLLRQPSSCNSPSSYLIEAIGDDEFLIINGEKYEAKTYCFGWDEGDRVSFVDGSAFGACTSTTIFNLNKLESCELWCE